MDLFEGYTTATASEIEDAAVRRGRAEGEAHGSILGEEEGLKLGTSAGGQLGDEVGKIKGCCLAWRHLTKEDPTFCSAKAAKSLSSLEALVDAFPRTNTSSDVRDFGKDISLIRAKFKVVKSLLGVGASQPQQGSLAF